MLRKAHDVIVMVRIVSYLERKMAALSVVGLVFRPTAEMGSLNGHMDMEVTSQLTCFIWIYF